MSGRIFHFLDVPKPQWRTFQTTDQDRIQYLMRENQRLQSDLLQAHAMCESDKGGRGVCEDCYACKDVEVKQIREQLAVAQTTIKRLTKVCELCCDCPSVQKVHKHYQARSRTKLEVKTKGAIV